ncbi:MAG: GntR family transcriptional regulator [Synergistaceae bacterium]|nr:GntR family transcriptional regulator [Synergistaceae bacterium]
MAGRIFHSLGDQVFETIKEHIINNTYKPGVVLQIDKIAAEFGVSTTPVREALLRLEGIGLVDIERNKGAVVTQVSEKKSRYVWEFRSLLESRVSRDAAVGCTDEQIDAVELKLKDVHEHPDDFAIYQESDTALHNLLASCTENPLILESLGNLSVHARRIRYFAENGPFREEVIEQVTKEHSEIIAALRLHDPDKVEEVVNRHLMNAEDRTIKALLETAEKNSGE